MEAAGVMFLVRLTHPVGAKRFDTAREKKEGFGRASLLCLPLAEKHQTSFQFGSIFFLQ